jgi:hypothetical protein
MQGACDKCPTEGVISLARRETVDRIRCVVPTLARPPEKRAAADAQAHPRNRLEARALDRLFARTSAGDLRFRTLNSRGVRAW